MVLSIENFIWTCFHWIFEVISSGNIWYQNVSALLNNCKFWVERTTFYFFLEIWSSVAFSDCPSASWLPRKSVLSELDTKPAKCAAGHFSGRRRQTITETWWSVRHCWPDRLRFLFKNPSLLAQSESLTDGAPKTRGEAWAPTLTPPLRPASRNHLLLRYLRGCQAPPGVDFGLV